METESVTSVSYIKINCVNHLHLKKIFFRFRDATQELIKRGARTEVYCDYVKSEFRAFLGQLPKKKGQHYAFEKQYLQSYKNQQPISMMI